MPIIKLSLPAGSHAVTLPDSETLLVDVPVEYSTQSPSPPPHVVQDAQTQTEQAAGEKRVTSARLFNLTDVLAMVLDTEHCDEYAPVQKEFEEVTVFLEVSFAIVSRQTLSPKTSPLNSQEIPPVHIYDGRDLSIHYCCQSYGVQLVHNRSTNVPWDHCLSCRISRLRLRHYIDSTSCNLDPKGAKAATQLRTHTTY